MDTLNSAVREYTLQLGGGQIQRAYRGILSFMTGLGRHLRERYPGHAVGALYPGFLDMTYFSFTPPELKERKLKIAIVYLHGEGRFEAWLGGSSREVQAEYIRLLGGRPVGKYRLSKPAPGVDSILESVLADRPDFDCPEELRETVGKNAMAFIRDVNAILNGLGKAPEAGRKGPS